MNEWNLMLRWHLCDGPYGSRPCRAKTANVDDEFCDGHKPLMESMTREAENEAIVAHARKVIVGPDAD